MSWVAVIYCFVILFNDLLMVYVSFVRFNFNVYLLIGTHYISLLQVTLSSINVYFLVLDFVNFCLHFPCFVLHLGVVVTVLS